MICLTSYSSFRASRSLFLGGSPFSGQHFLWDDFLPGVVQLSSTYRIRPCTILSPHLRGGIWFCYCLLLPCHGGPFILCHDLSAGLRHHFLCHPLTLGEPAKFSQVSRALPGTRAWSLTFWLLAKHAARVRHEMTWHVSLVNSPVLVPSLHLT